MVNDILYMRVIKSVNSTTNVFSYFWDTRYYNNYFKFIKKKTTTCVIYF